MKLLESALQLRSIEVTERNPISSRSHAVCCIRFLQDDDDDGNKGNSKENTSDNGQERITSDVNETFVPGGQITLVDLAGSERNYETIKMTAAQHRESAEINFALMALKDCFRASYLNYSASKSAARKPTASRNTDVPRYSPLGMRFQPNTNTTTDNGSSSSDISSNSEVHDTALSTNSIDRYHPMSAKYSCSCPYTCLSSDVCPNLGLAGELTEITAISNRGNRTSSCAYIAVYLNK
jgi:hypothetical protein